MLNMTLRGRGGCREVAVWNATRLIIGTLVIWGLVATAASAQDDQLARGKYLVALGGCMDCHTSGWFLGHPDMNRFLGGSDVGIAVPGLGVFVGANITPDKETGLGSWTRDEIATAITTGRRPDGRVLAPVMPWQSFAQLTHADALAIAAYLQSLPPVRQNVPGPFGPGDHVSVSVMELVPAAVHNKLLQHPTASPPPAE